MNWFNKPRFWLVCAVALVALLLLQQFWQWEIERVEVGSGQVLVRVHRWGQDLAPDEIVAPDDAHKGVMQEVNQAG
ncbi:MAG TPA: hypothetical protein VFA18_15405, partial [Gemmataceae bacterium]|nr:hypothetical protein [Gemmataceae bacterium]